MSSFYVIGDLYNSLFMYQVSHPEEKVDYALWNRIMTGLPPDYKMPDPNMVIILQHLQS